MRKSLPIIAALTMWLAACQTDLSRAACPTLITYSRDYLTASAAELKAIANTHPRIAEMIADYSKARDQIRVCRGTTK